MSNQQNWWQLSSIQIGGVICLPVILVGQTISQSYGFTSAVFSILIGNAILLFLGLISAKMSHESRKTTIDNALEYFGEKGVSFFALTMGVTLLGWFAIQLNMMSLSVLDLLAIEASRSIWLLFLNIFLGILITVVALYGLRALNILADLSLPLLIATLGYALFTVEEKAPLQEPAFSLGGVSLVIAIFIAGIIDLPTYFRHARSSKDGMISILIIFGLALPLLEIVGVYLASGYVEGSILDVLKRNNGVLWNLWIALFLILAGWTTNNLNLYSAVVCLESLLKKQTTRNCTLLAGGVGTFLSCFNLLNHLELALDLMGVLVASMGIVIITRYLIVQFNGPPISPNDERWHLVAWILGIAVGFYSLIGYSLTSIPVLDAAIGASLGTFLILTQRKSYEHAYSR